MSGACELHQPRLCVMPTADAVAERAAGIVIDVLNSEPTPVLGLATGRTPLKVYALLRAAVAKGETSFAAARCFNLDEYRGLGAEHPSSYRRYMARELFNHVDIALGAWHLPDGCAEPAAAGRRYEEQIRAAGGIDFQILGIGENGHIGFNEPGAPFDSRTREVRLAPATLAANAPEFPAGEEPPSTAITMGIGTILEARALLLLATGTRKAAALHAALQGPVGERVPASALRLHPRTTVLCDAEAASLLTRD